MGTGYKGMPWEGSRRGMGDGKELEETGLCNYG